LEHGNYASIALHSPGKLLSPENHIRGRVGCKTTTSVPMPEATMDKDNGPVLRKHDIWATGHSGHMEAISESPFVQKFSKAHFR